MKVNISTIYIPSAAPAVVSAFAMVIVSVSLIIKDYQGT
jgi:hypothetical protein